MKFIFPPSFLSFFHVFTEIGSLQWGHSPRSTPPPPPSPAPAPTPLPPPRPLSPAAAISHSRRQEAWKGLPQRLLLDDVGLVQHVQQLLEDRREGRAVRRDRRGEAALLAAGFFQSSEQLDLVAGVAQEAAQQRGPAREGGFAVDERVTVVGVEGKEDEEEEREVLLPPPR